MKFNDIKLFVKVVSVFSVRQLYIKEFNTQKSLLNKTEFDKY